jgi:NADPH:quinone reductase-like Zn-dependent oxidoreductase
MKNLVVFGANGGRGPSTGLQLVTVDGVTTRCGIVSTPDLVFDPRDPARASAVLVRVRAYSCNYRDKAYFYRMREVPAHRFFAIGSEFVGEVLATGPQVTTLTPGDRVIPNHHYTGAMVDEAGLREGIATNQASKELQILPERKLLRIPPGMSDPQAAAFSLGAQTAYSMVRKLELEPGSRVLVASATSNTSLFLLGVLRRNGARVWVTTTSGPHADQLLRCGAEEVLDVSGPRPGPGRPDPLAGVAQRVGGFHAVCDPFFDLHLERAVGVLKPFGKYITCGLAGQNPNSAKAAGVAGLDMSTVMGMAILKNLSIQGNCIGLGSDLTDAIADFVSGAIEPIVDSVFQDAEVGPFLDRTFNDRNRFGKVVFQYRS